MTKPNLRAILCAAVVLCSAQGAVAADSPFRLDTQQASASTALNRRIVPLLTRLEGRGRDTVESEILTRFGGAPEKVVHRDASTTVMGGQWWAEIGGSGTFARYRDKALLAAGARGERSAGDRPTSEELEPRAREFIRSELGDMFAIEPSEVRLWKTTYQINGVGNVETGERLETLASVSVVFTRVVNGMAVVGPGSKIAVVFSADEKVAGFDVDWSPVLASGDEQKTVPVAEFKERATQLRQLRVSDAAGARISTECGYYDPGTLERDATTTLQAACVVRYTVASAHGTVAAFEDIVPLGQDIILDPHWPESLAIGQSRSE